MKYYAFIYRTLIIMTIGSLMLQGCKKGENNDDDGSSGEFELVGYTVQDGVDTEGNPKKRVTFQLSGTENLHIAFFSGDIGGNYEYRDGRVQKLEELNLSFESNCSNGTANGPQGCGVDVFSIMASTDFNGGDEEADIRTATWVNITDRFTISPFETGTSVYHASGVANIADLTSEGQPLYLAARHITYNQIDNGLYSAFRVRNWAMSGGMAGEEPIVLSTTVGEAGFRKVEIGNFNGTGRNPINATLITLRGNHGSDETLLRAQTECWAIAAPITMTDISIEADLPLRVKQSHQPAVKTFAFNYNGPGEYNAVFVLSKDDGSGESVAKHVTIVIPE